MGDFFTEKSWIPETVLEFWQQEHGELNEHWKQKFVSSPVVLEICLHHPANIRRAIQQTRKIEVALSLIHQIESKNEESAEKLYDDFHPNHARGITNAHLGDRTTDPFDPKRDDLLFKCERCNLKLSLLRKSQLSGFQNLCRDCAGED